MADTKRNVSILIEAKDQASQTMKGLNGVLIGMAATAAALTAAFVAAAAAFKQAVDAAAAQQASDVKLAAALRTLGENTAETRAHLNALAGELQDLTTVDDNVIQSVAGVLASLGRLKGEGLDRAIKATLDFSAATGQDAVAAANLVAKAADGYTSALTRYGIKVDEGQNKTEAFSQALGIMETKFGGIAEASGRTFEGNLARIGLNLGDTLEILGDSVVKSEAFNEVLRTMAQAFKDLQPAIKENLPTIQAFAEFVLRSGLVVTRALTEMVEQLFRLPAHVKQAFEALPDIPDKAIAGLQFLPNGIGAALRAYDDLRAATVGLAGDLEGPGNTAAGVFEELGSEIAELLKRLEDMKGGTVDVAEGLGNVAVSAGAMQGPLTALDEALKSIGGKGLAELKDAAANVRTAFDEIVASFESGAISEEQFDLMITQVKAAGEAIRIAGGDIEAFLTTTGLVPEAVIQMFEAVEQQAASVSENMELAEDVSAAAATSIGSEFVDAFFGAERGFKKFAESFLAMIAQMIARALILRAITTAFSFFGGPAGAAAAGAFNEIGNFGGNFSTEGVPAPVAVSPTIISGRAVTGGSSTLNVGIFPAPDARQNALNVLQEINDLAERHGMRVVATELRA